MHVLIIIKSGILADCADFYGILQSLQENSRLIFLFTYCGLFNNAVRSSDCIALNVRIITD